MELPMESNQVDINLWDKPYILIIGIDIAAEHHHVHSGEKHVHKYIGWGQAGVV